MKTIERSIQGRIQEIVIPQNNEEMIKACHASLRLINPSLKILSILDENLKNFWEEEVRSYYEDGELYVFTEFPLSKRNVNESAEVRFYSDKIATMTFTVRNFKRIENIILEFRRKNPNYTLELCSPIIGDADLVKSSWSTMLELIKYFNR